MIFEILNGVMYQNNRRFCYAKVNDGSASVQHGSRAVRTQYSHHHGKVLPIVDGLGWVGTDKNDAVCVGQVLGNDGPLPCELTISRLIAAVESCEDVGRPVLMEISNG
jgi:hypothetical protein